MRVSESTPQGRAGDELVDVPAPVVPVVDSTGAGDSFCAGLVFGLLRGATVGQAARLANACGAAAVTIPGAGAFLPGRAEVLDLLADQPEPALDGLLALLASGQGTESSGSVQSAPLRGTALKPSGVHSAKTQRTAK